MSFEFAGQRSDDATTVTQDAEPLKPITAMHIRTNDAGAFDWGRESAGSRLLAYTVLVKTVGPRKAAQWYERFALQVVHQLGDSWAFNAEQVAAWVAAQTHTGEKSSEELAQELVGAEVAATKPKKPKKSAAKPSTTGADNANAQIVTPESESLAGGSGPGRSFGFEAEDEPGPYTDRR